MTLIINDENLLRAKCEDVRAEEVEDLIKSLEDELAHCEQRGYPGIGLAAPQIGIYKSIAIIRMGDIKINLINATIKHSHDKFIFKDEGCLSFPDQKFDTIRYKEVYIENKFYPSFVASGLLAVACQHELDHLNSTLIFDRKNI